MERYRLEIDISALQQDLETMSLCEQFFSADRDEDGMGFPIADTDHSRLLGVFWNQAVCRLASLLSGWSESAVTYGRDSVATRLTVEFHDGIRPKNAMIRMHIEDALTHSVLARLAESAGYKDRAGSFQAESDASVDRLLCSLL